MDNYLQGTSNILLFKDGVGRSKPPSYSLPKEGFAYGKKVGHDAEGVREGKKNPPFSYIINFLY